MVMDPRFGELFDSKNGFEINDDNVFPGFDQFPNLAIGYPFKDESLDLSFFDLPFPPPNPDPGNFAPSSGMSSEVDNFALSSGVSSEVDNFAPSSSVSSEVDSPDDSSDTVLKFLNQILLEENMEEKPSMFHDPLALQAAEKSFYEVLGEKHPPLPYRSTIYIDQNVESQDESFFGSSSEYSTNSSTSAGNSIDPQWAGDSLEVKSSIVQTHPLEYFSSQPTFQTSSQGSFGSINSFSNNIKGSADSYVSTHLVPNIFSDSNSILQFKRGMEEASKFLPSANQIVIDLDKYSLPLESKEGVPEVVVKVEKDERDNSLNASRGRKHYHRQDSDFFDEGRSSKQSAVYVEEEELSEMFDRVLLCADPVACNELPSEEGKTLPHNGQTHGSNSSGKTSAKKQGSKSEAVDLRALLISCAQSVATDDRRTANELLKQIRQHSSPSGDSSERLARICANGLEARLAGTGTLIYASLASKRISAAEKIKAYQVYFSACPFKKVSISFANKMILETASKATTLHIIDFGIQYGFQWPILIQQLSTLRSGGPPKLRITGIELPQPGFRPAERVEETGRRLANYCERFKVPFEYHAIATEKWETLKIEDFKIESNEFLAVNCLLRFQNLLDETVVVNSPRDAVLKLIRKMNPDIFVHAVINGSYNAPFFVTRFREALFHYSSLFDMFDSTLPREDQHRSNFENEFYGREALNVIACEGSERVERPETYKQWQVRTIRAGFRPLPANREILKKLRAKVMSQYHKDFVFDEDNHWLLQGWKGRIICASSCWIPA